MNQIELFGRYRFGEPNRDAQIGWLYVDKHHLQLVHVLRFALQYLKTANKKKSAIFLSTNGLDKLIVPQ